MNTQEAIYSRRTIRNFNGENITDTELNEILKSAYASPIGRAMYDTLSITVISNKELLERWEKQMSDAIGKPDLHPFYGAPTVILVSSEIGEPPLNNVNYSNAAIIVQNMALSAVELGVGACHIWGAVRALDPSSDFIKEFDLPEGKIPCCAIALGHFDGEYELRDIPENRIVTNFIR